MGAAMLLLVWLGCETTCDPLGFDGCDRSRRCVTQDGDAWVQADDRVYDCDVSSCAYTTATDDCVMSVDCSWAETSAARVCEQRPEHGGDVVCSEFDLSAPGLGCGRTWACCDNDGDGPTCWSETSDGYVYLLGAEEQLVCDVCNVSGTVADYMGCT